MPRLPTITMSTDHDGPAILALLEPTYPYLVELDWSHVGPSWMLASLNDRLVGCLQVMPGLPVARLEYLGIHPGLSHTQRAKVAYTLMHTAMGACRAAGCSMVQGIIGRSYEHWVDRLVARGGTVVISGDTVARRLR